jgi:hypothetical protein
MSLNVSIKRRGLIPWEVFAMTCNTNNCSINNGFKCVTKFIKGMILLFVIPLIACDWPWSHESVDSTAILNLFIVNELSDSIHIRYIRPKVFKYGDSVLLSDPYKIEYQTNSFLINGLASKMDTITYKYKSDDYCTIDNWIVQYFRFTIEATINDSVIQSVEIYPWDTTIIVQRVGNCKYVSCDTINIQ